MTTLQQFMDQTGNEISKDQKWYFDFDAYTLNTSTFTDKLKGLFNIYDAHYDGKTFLVDKAKVGAKVMCWIRPSLAKMLVKRYGKKDKSFETVFGNEVQSRSKKISVTLPDNTQDEISITGNADAPEFFTRAWELFNEYNNKNDGYVSERKLRIFIRFIITNKEDIKNKLTNNIDISKIFLVESGSDFSMASDVDSKQEEALKSVKAHVNEYKKVKDFPFSRNRIIFGAPGTGKSFLANGNANYLLFNENAEGAGLAADDQEYLISSIEGEKKKELSCAKSWCMERVTFHPEYSYYDFVGSYKPVMGEKDKEGKRKIEYRFVPGPFIRILVKALNDENHPYLLLIEEINRARVAAVFGDIFQLLDRTDKGESEYSICLSEDLKEHLQKEGLSQDELKLPPNLYIWATMNSADQGVYPLDTAFKRRWSMEYRDINAGSQNDNWNKIREGINDLLKPYINEDKLMGYYFLKEEERSDARLEDSLKSKVLMYLFDDAAKPCKKQIFKKNIHTYSELRNSFSLDEPDLGIFEKATSWPGELKSKWKAIRSGINSRLRKCGIPENKMLGYFFLKKEEKENENQLKAALCDKVLKYLLDTVADDHRSELFQLSNNAEINFDNLKKAMENAMQGEINPNSNLGVFSEALQQPAAER